MDKPGNALVVLLVVVVAVVVEVVEEDENMFITDARHPPTTVLLLLTGLPALVAAVDAVVGCSCGVEFPSLILLLNVTLGLGVLPLLAAAVAAALDVREVAVYGDEVEENDDEEEDIFAAAPTGLNPPPAGVVGDEW